MAGIHVNRIKTLMGIAIFLLPNPDLYAQTSVEKMHSVEYYVKNVLLGSDLKVAKIKYTGKTGGMGQFTANQDIFGLASGLVLSTGHVDSILGPNTSSAYTSFATIPETKQQIKISKRGDRDLNRLCKKSTADISVIEFDFIPVNNTIEFNYIFASEEYPEYVGTSYNDVFGFFLSGPGIKGKVNLAVLADGQTAISVNNINHKKNQLYFRMNKKKMTLFQHIFYGKAKRKNFHDRHNQTQFDGLTCMLRVHHDVIPYQKYHIKIAVGDVGDGNLDSAVFLESGSFSSQPDSEGKHYDKIEQYKNRLIDTDSIFGIKSETGDPLQTRISEELNEEFEFTDVQFDLDSYMLSDTAKMQLEKLAAHLTLNQAFKCNLSGYTDNLGSKKYNQKLSEKRAVSVIEFLCSKGVERERMTYTGHNFQNPKSSNSSSDGRAINRRVEISLEE